MPKEDDRFRETGSKYEHEEPIAFFLFKPGIDIDKNWNQVHSQVEYILYVPETLFKIAHNFAQDNNLHIFGGFDFYKTQSFNPEDCSRLVVDLSTIHKASDNEDFKEFIAQLSKLAEGCINNRGNLHLYASGP